MTIAILGSRKGYALFATLGDPVLINAVTLSIIGSLRHVMR